MLDPRDIVDIGGCSQSGAAARDTNGHDAGNGPRSRFLSVWYKCCRVYGRMYRNQEHSAYKGRCPRCGSSVSARIGPGGTRRRMFEAG